MQECFEQIPDNSLPALVILSGGQDSTTCLYIAKRCHSVVHAITFDYGQTHRLEIEAAKKVASLAGVKSHEIVTIPDCLVSSSPLIDPNATLERYENAEQMNKEIGDRRELTFIPMRNGLFLTIAANRAVTFGGAWLYTGICQTDSANYDDCRQSFVVACANYIHLALGNDHRAGTPIKIAAPLINMTKAESVNLASTMADCWEALAWTHTSYDGKYPPTDMNHANVLRADGFEKAGLPDPLVLRAVQDGLMKLPDTPNYTPIVMLGSIFGIDFDKEKLL